MRNFSEREFYLAEFRGRSIGIAWPGQERPGAGPLADVIAELVSNASRVVILSPLDEVFEIAGVGKAVGIDDPNFAPRLWRDLREEGRAGLKVSTRAFEEDCRRAALSLSLAKVVWIQSAPPIERREGEGRISVVDLAHLEPLLAEAPEALSGPLCVREGQAPMLRAIRALIEGGVPSVNVCTPRDLVRELFTYSGAGMFFTRDRYAEVRPLAIDDFDLANDLIERGEADGFLVPRDREARDDVLAHGVGVFIEGRYLAGIGAILPHSASNAAELASLFALTRYVGEGAGGQIVRYAIDHARSDDLDYLFSCTMSARVEAFFERHGFRRVTREEVPKAKWRDYGPARLERVRCLRFDLKG
ncbi:MAG: GNAT family N-acetyltransferase [bacterium]|nr:GNAT family N-acetyltransferase [bacterium]